MRPITHSRITTWVTSLSLTASLFTGLLVTSHAQATSVNEVSKATENSKGTVSVSHPTLSRYARNLTKRAAKGQPESVNGYSKEIRRTIEVLNGDSNRSPVLLSDSGEMTRVIAEGLAERMITTGASEVLRNKELFVLDLDKLSAAARDEREFTKILQNVLAEVESAQGRIILFVDQLHQYIGSYTSPSASAILQSAMERRNLRIVGATSRQAYSEYIAGDAGLSALFQEVPVGDSNNADVTDNEEDVKDSKRDEVGFAGDKISSELRSMMHSASSDDDRISLIVQVKDLTNGKLNALLKNNSVRVDARLQRLGVMTIDAPIKAVERLAASSHTNYISLNQQIQSLGHISLTTGADAVRNQVSVGATTTIDGTGLGIAVVDSGIDTGHKTFLGRDDKSRIVFSRDFTGENRFDDPYGHGTHVASIAAGNGRIADAGYIGIAPNASIINLRVLNSRGTGTVAGTLAALDWLLANHAAYKIRVVNMSLGTPAVDSYKNDPVCRAVRRLVDAGVVVVAAAGNNGKNSAGQKVYGQIHCPGNEPAAITVGASNTLGTNARNDDGVASFSSRGPTRSGWRDSVGVKHYDNLIKPELVAPGNKVIDAESDNNLLVTQNPQLDAGVSPSENRRHMYLSGSSMATPGVAGAAALLLQANPKLTPNMVKALLMYSAQPLSGFNSFEQGAGQLNIEGAMRLARLVRTDLGSSKPIGANLLTTSVPPVAQTTIGGHTFTWSQGIILGQHFAKGTSLILKYQPIYALGVVISEGVVVSNGVVINDGVVISDGVVVSDGVVITDGVVISDGVVVTDGIVISDGLSLGSGSIFARMGKLVGDGVLVSDGSVLGDGVVVSDGVVVTDGVVISDSVVIAQSAQLNGDFSLASVVIDSGLDCLDY